MVLEAGHRRGVVMGRGRTIAFAAIATVLWCAAAPAFAQSTLNETVAGRAGGQGNARLLVEAKEIVYDNDRNTVSASGDVELNYQGRTLQVEFWDDLVVAGCALVFHCCVILEHTSGLAPRNRFPGSPEGRPLVKVGVDTPIGEATWRA